MPLLFGALGPTTLLILVGLGALLFVKKLPEFGRLFGRSVTEFQRGLRDEPDATTPSPAKDQGLPSKHS
jgi:Sec-independent protein translocase protein TatA